MRKLQSRTQKPIKTGTTPIDWAAIKKKILVMKFQPGYKPTTQDDWILENGVWNDSLYWVDTDNWKDS